MSVIYQFRFGASGEIKVNNHFLMSAHNEAIRCHLNHANHVRHVH